MAEIPKQLKEHRFVKTKEKRPVQPNWNNNTTIVAKDIEKDATYGVLCGYNSLMVIDCDNEDAEQYCLTHPVLQRTFTVKSASKKLSHFYVYVDIEHPQTKRYNDTVTGERACDLQGEGTQVIGPNSKLDNGKKYVIHTDYEIAYVPYNELTEFLEKRYSTQSKKKKEFKEVLSYDPALHDPLVKYIKSTVSIIDVLNKSGFDPGSNPGKCPYGHSSQGGKCFSYTYKFYNCFHCDKSGDVFTLYQDIHNVPFLEAKEQLAKIAGAGQTLREQSVNYIALKQRHEMTELLVKQFLENNHVYTTRNSNKSEIWIYKEGIYVPDGETYIEEFVLAAIGAFYSSHIANQVIDKIKSSTYIKHEDLFINEDERKIPVLNGILDIFTRELEPFSPKYTFFTKIPVTYDASQKNELFEKFQSEIHKTVEDVKINQEMYGYCLLRNYKFEKAIMKIGGGRNGKSKDIECLKRLLGANNCVSIPLQTLENDKFIIAELHNKLANLGPDISNESLKHTANIKGLTGGDTFTADRKFKNKINFVNHAKMIFGTNNLPDVKNDESFGWHARWIFLEYPYRFEDPDVYYSLTSQERLDQNIRLADKNIVSKMTTPEGLSGILNWALEGLSRLTSQKQFTKNNSAGVFENEWRRRANSWIAFFSDMLEVSYDEDDYVSTMELTKEYKQYCVTHKLSNKQKNSDIYEHLTKEGCIKQRKNTEEGFIHVWKLLKWKSGKKPVAMEELVNIKLDDIKQFIFDMPKNNEKYLVQLYGKEYINKQIHRGLLARNPKYPNTLMVIQ